MVGGQAVRACPSLTFRILPRWRCGVLQAAAQPDDDPFISAAEVRHALPAFMACKGAARTAWGREQCQMDAPDHGPSPARE